MVRFAADACSHVGQQPDPFTCMAEPFVGCFGKVVVQLGNLILFHGITPCELNNCRDEHFANTSGDLAADQPI